MLTANNVESSGLPGHLPIAAEFRLTELNEMIPRIRKPASFPTNMPHQPKLAESILAKAGDLKFEDVNQAYNTFSRVAEEYLLQAADVTRQRFSGRGKVPTFVLEPRFCPQGKHGAGCESAPLRRLKRLLRRIEQLRQFCSQESLLSWRASRLWKNIIPITDFCKASP